jgi:WD40 repeat protein
MHHFTPRISFRHGTYYLFYRKIGALTAFAIDHRHTWLLSGSSRGVLTLWDLRFRIPLRSWMHPRRSRIHRIVIHPGSKSRGRIVAISAGVNEVSIWDVEKMQCTDVFAMQGRRDDGEISADPELLDHYVVRE